MELAVVVGHCTATVKDASLSGRRFALVRGTDDTGKPVGGLEAALDVTGAGVGQVVLLTRGSAARQPAENRQLAADLSIVAIVDDLTLPPAPWPTPTARRRTTAKRTTRGAAHQTQSRK